MAQSSNRRANSLLLMDPFAMWEHPDSLLRVQSHDILSKTSRDILYTPAQAQRAREKAWPGRRWMFRNSACGLW